MIEQLEAAVRKQAFTPDWWGVFVQPFWIARRGLARGIGAHATAIRGRVLDVGCGSKPYRELFPCDEYIGLEVATGAASHPGVADVVYDGGRLPFDDAAFDAVFCSQVLEHVKDVDSFLSDCARVLRPGGTLLLSVPFMWDEHEQPNDFRRYTTFGAAQALTRAGFSILSLKRSVTGPAVLVQLWLGWLYKCVNPKSGYGAVLLTLFVSPITLMGLMAAWILPAGDDLFIDVIVLGKRL